MISHLYHKIKFVILERKINKNPHIGKEDVYGIYDYKEGPYGVRYRIVKLPQGIESIQWVSERRHLSAYEEREKRIRHRLFRFWRYQGWLIFFRPPILFLLLISIFIFYFGLMERQEVKIERYKLIVASVVGVNPKQIQYIDDGWLEISSKRETVVDKVYEPIRYSFNPVRWIFSSQAGFISRWRGETYGYVTHPLVYNEKGEVWLNKEGTWRHGKITGKAVEWDLRQGTGIRAGKIAGHDISTKDKKLYIFDK